MSCCWRTIRPRGRLNVAVRRGLSEAERATWAEYLRSVVPLPGRDQPEAPVLPAPPAPPPTASSSPAPAPSARVVVRAAPLSVGAPPAGLDARSWQRFRAGQLAPARTLDLHGRTAPAAFQALAGFLHRAQADRLRCVEVITGRGSGPEGGVIRRELPLWLNLPELRPLVLAAAHPHAGNVGSVRLLLRRPR
jgi:DNA-nicking Smr family endonuclease